VTIGGIGVSVGLDNKLRVWETSNGILRVRFNINLKHYLRINCSKCNFRKT
jgi:predicted nucleic-acid-binding Zn-ribbon protein